MITLSNEYSTHFHDIYVDGKENAKMTGDRMKMLMLTLPFMVRDLITPEVLQCMYVLVCTVLTLVCSGLYWYELGYSSNEVVEVLIQCMEWNMATRQSRITEAELPELQQKAVDLLENLPDKTGEKGKWNFEKAHSILHKVREIVLWGNSDNTSCQAPEVKFLYALIHPWYIPVQT